MKNITHVTRWKIEQLLTGSWNFVWLLVGYSLVTCSCSFSCSTQLKETHIYKYVLAFCLKDALSCCICVVDVS